VTGLQRAAVPLGLAVVAAATVLVPGLVAMGVAGAAILALVLWAPPVWSLALPVVLVQVAGEGLHLPALPLGVAQLAYLPAAGAVALHRMAGLSRLTGPVDRWMAAVGLVTALATLVGMADLAPAALIWEDVVPIVFLVLTYVATRLLVRTKPEFEFLLKAMLAGSCLAFVKVLFLLAVPVPVGWEGPWQAIRVMTSGFPRVILRGADLFFVVGSVVVFARLVWRARATAVSAVAGLLSLGGAMLSGTRSNWIGLATGVAAVALAAVARSRAGLRRVAAGVAAGVVLVTLTLAWSEGARGFVGRLGELVGSRSWTVTFRLLEAEGVIDAIGSRGALGSGMGSTFVYADFERQAMTSTTWNHNAYLQWLHKAGFVGLLVFMGLAVRALRTAFRLVRGGHPWAEGLLGIAGALVAVLVLSLTANKVFEFSGAMFLGLAFAAIQSADDSERPREVPPQGPAAET
jgi:O-antigen ligase